MMNKELIPLKILRLGCTVVTTILFTTAIHYIDYAFLYWTYGICTSIVFATIVHLSEEIGVIKNKMKK